MRHYWEVGRILEIKLCKINGFRVLIDWNTSNVTKWKNSWKPVTFLDTRRGMLKLGSCISNTELIKEALELLIVFYNKNSENTNKVDINDIWKIMQKPLAGQDEENEINLNDDNDIYQIENIKHYYYHGKEEFLEFRFKKKS